MTSFVEMDELKILKLAVEQAFNAVLITSADDGNNNHPIIYANQAFCEMTGYSIDELIGQDPRMLQGAATSEAVLDNLRSCIKEKRLFHGATVNYRKDGQPYHVEWNISPISNDIGQVTHYLSIQRDITHQLKLEEKSEVLISAFDASGDAIFITNKDAKIEFVNESFVRLTGFSRPELLGSKPSILKSGLHDDNFYKNLWQTILKGKTFRAVFINKNKKGQRYHQEQTITPIFNKSAEITYFVSISKDITQRIEEEAAFRQQAKLDSLTGALIRREGQKRLEESVSLSAGSDNSLSIAFIDIDHFKQVNDTWGHPVGDEVIQMVASAIMDSVRSTDALVRWGGEEFMLIMNQCQLNTAQQLVWRCVEIIRKISHAQAGRVTVSAGVAEKLLNEDIAALIRRADEALYAAKSSGRNTVVLAKESH